MKNRLQVLWCWFQGMQKRICAFSLSPKTYSLEPLAPSARGMTLIETLVAISILTVAIISPMSLTMQSLSASYYARDQITAFNLGQEAIESVRAVRDGNILAIAFGTTPNCPDGEPMHLLCGIPIATPFTIDTRNNQRTPCTLPDGSDSDILADCPPLQTDGDLYGYDEVWTNTRYKRTVIAEFIPGTQDEIRVTVTVEWVVGRQTRTFVIYENLYRWVIDGSV